MKKIFNFSGLLLLCMALMLPVLTSCDNDDFDTQQYKGGIHLNVWGPCPVARGGELRFLGSGLNQIKSIELPGCGEITDITVVSPSEIRITVPQNAEPGKVVLHHANGEITSQTLLSFTEPIILESMTPMTVKPGQELTISGDYLNLIHEVIFSEDVVVDEEEFTAHSRYEIKLIVPAEARSGEVIISDGAEEMPNWIHSEEELTVVLPSFASVADLADKKPGDVIELPGQDLDLVTKVEMPNGDELEFTVADGKISFVLPENASDGVINVIAAPGVKVPVATIGMAVPTDLSVTPSTELRAGDNLEISGTNLELVSAITFAGASAASDFTLENGKITVAMPAAAISGDITLDLLSGKNVTLHIETAKPGNISYASASAPLGESMTVTGNNLDVVSEIEFAGGVKATPSSLASDRLEVVIPTKAENGKLIFRMANGESVEGPEMTFTSPTCAWISDLPEKFVKGQRYTLTVVNIDKLQNVTLNGVQAKYMDDPAAGTMLLQIPSDLEGTFELKLISSNGEMSYQVAIIPAETIAYEGPTMLTWGEEGRFGIDLKFFKDAKPGDVLKIYLTQTPNWGQAQLNDGTWSPSIPFGETAKFGSESYIKTDEILSSKDIDSVSLVLTDEVLAHILGNAGDYFGLNTAYNLTGQVGMVIQGSDIQIDKVVFIYQ